MARSVGAMLAALGLSLAPALAPVGAAARNIVSTDDDGLGSNVVENLARGAPTDLPAGAGASAPLPGVSVAFNREPPQQGQRDDEANVDRSAIAVSLIDGHSPLGQERRDWLRRLVARLGCQNSEGSRAG